MSAQASSLPAYFDSLYGAAEDPYGVRSRWYEARKRALLLASLTRPGYRSAYEPGCGTAELTAALAARCQRVLASDFNGHAVEVARRRTAALPHVRVERHALPQDWPRADGPFDLIVLGEIGYFIEPAAWAEVAQAGLASLAADGDLVACDWRPDFAERRQSTQAVQEALERLGLRRLVRHEEDDFVLQLWSRDARSVAAREGIG